LTGPDRQREIYLDGASGFIPETPFLYPKLEFRAKNLISQKAFAYIAGGAGRGDTMKANERAFQNWQIVPRMLRNISKVDTSIELFGERYPHPFLLAPIGVLEMVSKKGDIEVAKAAADLEIPFIFSNQASAPMEACAAVMGDSPRWFQLYWSKSPELVASMIRRAEQSGCSAIVITLDTTFLGWRTQDLELGYLPFLEGKGIAQYTYDPIFRQLMETGVVQASRKIRITASSIRTLIEMKKNYPHGSFWKKLRSSDPVKAVRTFVDVFSKTDLTWEDLSYIKQLTKLPVILKGILSEEDARMALWYNMDGIIVSNHGGRQIDGEISSLEALPGIVKAVGGKIPVLFDSGIRGGADIFKALALGAKAVLIGRPYAFALAVNKTKGVHDLLCNFAAEFEFTMALSGCVKINEIGLESLNKNKFI
jgi:lactate 2-monooxygenase